VRRFHKYVILLFVTLASVILDQVSKTVVLQHFRLGDSINIIPGLFALTYVRNTGAAFGLLAHADPAFRVPFFVIVPIAALLAIGYVFRRIPDRDTKLSSALSLVIGGAIGNLLDRLRLGFVVDFLDFHWKFQTHFPAFNVADSAICVGVGILMWDLLRQNTENHASPTL